MIDERGVGPWPEWTDIAFFQLRDLMHEEDLTLHRRVCKRLRAHWLLLESSVWMPLLDNARSLGARQLASSSHAWEDELRANVFAAVYRWGREDRNNINTVLARAEELTKTNRAIQANIGLIVFQLKQRAALIESADLQSEWPALELANCAVEFAISNSNTIRDLSSLESMVKRTGQAHSWSERNGRFEWEPPKSIGTLQDLLQYVADSHVPSPEAEFADDAASLEGARPGVNPIGQPMEIRRICGSLETAFWWLNQECRLVRAIDCMTPGMLSTLLRVARGFDPTEKSSGDGTTVPFNKRQVGSVLPEFKLYEHEAPDVSQWA